MSNQASLRVCPSCGWLSINGGEFKSELKDLIDYNKLFNSQAMKNEYCEKHKPFGTEALSH